MLELRSDSSPTCQLVVRFAWHVDRYVHRIALAELQSDGRWFERSLFDQPPSSDNSKDAEDWPRNPPLQQIDRCSLANDRRGLVGLGMAGRSHWSLAVEGRPKEIEFEVACRLHDLPKWLGSSYALDAGVRDVAEPTQQVLVLAVDGGSSSRSIELRVDTSSTVLHWNPAHRGVELRPRAGAASWPATVRWSYTLQLTP